MKKHLIFLFLLFGANTFAQDQNPKSDEKIYSVSGLEVKPEFPGGLAEFYKFVNENLKLSDAGLKGNIFVTFVIEKDGSLSDLKILRDIGHGSGEEALRVLKMSPKWTPGMQNGVPVRTMYSLPIRVPATLQPGKPFEVKDKK